MNLEQRQKIFDLNFKNILHQIEDSDKELKYYYDYKNKYGPNHYIQSNYTKAKLYDIRDDDDETKSQINPRD